MRLNNKLRLAKAYRFLLWSYAAMMAVALIISGIGYAYSYWTIRQDIDRNYSAVLNREKLSYDKEWNRIIANTSTIASNMTLKRLAQQEQWGAAERLATVDLMNEINAVYRGYDHMDSIGVYFNKTKSFVTNLQSYGQQVNYLYLYDYDLSVEEFIASMTGLKGYFTISRGAEQHLVFYQNVFDNRFKEVIATSFGILPWMSLSDVGSTGFAAQNSGSFHINSTGRIIGNTNPRVDVSPIAYTDIERNNTLYDREIGGRDYILSSVSSDVLDMRYVIYAPRSVFFKNISFLAYIIAGEMAVCLVVGSFLAVYFSKKNYMPIEKLLSLLKIQRNETQDASFSQMYESLENSLQTLVVGHETLYQKLNSMDHVMERHVFNCLMRGWSLDSNWSEEYLARVKQQYDFSNYCVVLFSFDGLDKSIFARQQGEAGKPVDYPLMLFSVRNVINELVLKHEFDAPHEQTNVKGIAVDMGDMTACIVNCNGEEDRQILQDSAKRCIEFFQSAFIIDSYASISGVHDDLGDLDIAYEEAFITITHKSFWGNSLTDVLLFEDEGAGYSEPNMESRLFTQARKLTNCLMSKDYTKAGEVLDETLEKCFSKDISRLSYNQYQAATLICIILSNLSESDPEAELSAYTDWTSSSHIYSIKSLKDVRRNLFAALDEIAQKYEKSMMTVEEPDWLIKAEEYVKVHFADPDINITTIANKFNINFSYLGRTFKKHRGINMVDYIHQLRIQRCNEYMEQGMSVTDCAQKVGYINAKSLIRAYKRYEGITPGQYKTQKISLSIASELDS